MRPAADRVRVWTGRTALLVGGGGVVVFVGAALLVHTGPPAWDEQGFRAVNEVGPGLAAWLTPVSKLFLPAGIVAAAVIGALYSSGRTRSLWPVGFAGAAAVLAWILANLAKHVADRPRPYASVPDAVLRQHAARGTSFPSSHAAVALAVVIALVAFLPGWGAAVAVVYATVLGWSRVYLGVHFPLDVVAGLGLGCAVGGAVVLLERWLLGPPVRSHGAPAPPGP